MQHLDLEVVFREEGEDQDMIDNDDVYIRLQHGKGFHNLVYMPYVNT
jgi:hypothetical protein